MPTNTGTSDEQRSVKSPREALREIATSFDRLPLSDRDLDVLMHEYDCNATLARDTETHRSTVMTFVMTAVAAVIYALGALKFDPHYWPVPILVSVVGAYTAVLTNVYHERWEYFSMLARGYRLRIAAAQPDARIEEIRVAAKAAHRDEYRRQLQLFTLWNRLALGICVFGALCAVGMWIALLVPELGPR